MNETGAAAIDIASVKARHEALFAPNWRARTAVVGVIAAMTALYVVAFVTFDVPWARVVPGLRQLAWFVVAMFPPDPDGHLITYLNALGETLAIALLGTLLGAVLALPLGVLAARNVIPSAFLRLPIKRFFDAVRGVDTLIWALIWINVVGLGPFAGVLAIATSDFGALGKLFAEIIEFGRCEGTGRRAGRWRAAAGRGAIRASPAGASGDCGTGPLFHRIEHALGHDHRGRRRGGDWAASLRADSGVGMEASFLPHPVDPYLRRRDRLHFRQAARCHGRSSHIARLIG